MNSPQEVGKDEIKISHPPLIKRQIVGKVEDQTIAVSTHHTTKELAKLRIKISHPPLIERHIIGKVEE